MRLYPRAPFIGGETPASYASRLAIMNGVPVEVFCRDFQLGLVGLVRGEPESISRLAELAGEDADKISEAAWRTEGAFSHFRGHTFGAWDHRREGVRACIHCLRADRETAHLPGGAGVYFRGEWRLTGLRTCHIHNAPIVELPTPQEQALWRDFARRVAICGDELDAPSLQRSPSGLEVYVRCRLNDAPHAPTWLDPLPVYAAIASCEALGATSVLGPHHNRKKLSDDEWWLAGGRGYEIASAGADSIKALLTEVRLAVPERCHQPTPHAWFGALYKWLAGTKASDPVYDPLRDIVTGHLAETAALRGNLAIFGKPLPGRKLHSVRSAAAETGIHPRFIRRILDAKGIAAGAMDQKSDTEVIFEVAHFADAFRRLGSALHVQELGPYAGCSLRNARMLIKEGFIPPILESTADAPGIPRYAREDVDAFLVRLSAGAEVVHDLPPGAHPIATSPGNVPCPVSVVINLLLRGELAWSGRLEGVRGLHGILIDAREVRKKVIAPKIGDLTVHQAYPLLGVNAGGIHALARAGLIELLPIEQPRNARSLPRITYEQITTFRKTYVSMAEAARQLSRKIHLLRADLAAAGIARVDLPSNLALRLYRRQDIASLFPSIMEFVDPLAIMKSRRELPRRGKRKKQAHQIAAR